MFKKKYETDLTAFVPNDVFYILSLAPNSSPSFICTLYPVYVHYAHSVYTRIHTVHCTVFNIVCTYIHTRIHTVHYTIQYAHICILAYILYIIQYSMHIYTYCMEGWKNNKNKSSYYASIWLFPPSPSCGYKNCLNLSTTLLKKCKRKKLP